MIKVYGDKSSRYALIVYYLTFENICSERKIIRFFNSNNLKELWQMKKDIESQSLNKQVVCECSIYDYKLSKYLVHE